MFFHSPADPKYDLPARTWFAFASNRSGNPLFSGVGIEVGERVGRYFGTTCEPT